MKYLFFLLSVLLISLGCEDRNEDRNFKLIYPIETEEHANNFIFHWVNKISETSRIIIANNDRFSWPALDTDTITADSFYLNRNLRPATTYYWKIETPDGLSKSSSFTTRDYLTEYQGTYNVSTVRTNSDGTKSYYNNELELIAHHDHVPNLGNGFKIRAETTNLTNAYHPFDYYIGNQNKIIFNGYYSTWLHYFSRLEINTETDSIYFRFANANYDVLHEMRGKKE